MFINRRQFDLIEGASPERMLRPKSQCGKRRGFALVIVMVIISVSLIVTFAFVRAQTTALQISTNVNRGDLALQAAQTGAAVALRRMQSSDWEGVSQPLFRTTQNNSDGVTSFNVVFKQLPLDYQPTLPADMAFHVLVESTGSWTSATNQDEDISRVVEVVVRLQPRLPGRVIRAGDSEAANDLIPNPDDYDEIQTYAMFLKKGPLELEPGDRIDGNLFIKDKLKVYDSPHWGNSVRDMFLDELGQLYVPSTDPLIVQHPHPIAGSITFSKNPKKSVKSALTRLRVPWTTSKSIPKLPNIDFNEWTTYRLYEGGFEYDAEEVGGTLEDESFLPTPSNPLGVFYRKSDIRIRDNVVIQGTLVCKKKVKIEGNDIHISGLNWTDSNGTPYVENHHLWPHMPAIVANELKANRDTRCVIDGAVCLKKSLKGAGGEFEYINTPDVDFTGTATANPLQQSLSLVQLDGNPNLGGLNSDGDYAIWLQDGPTGAWYAIVGVDTENNELTVRGAVKHATATSFHVRRNRRRYLDIRGPVSGEKADIDRPPAWHDWDDDDWEDREEDWEEHNEDLDDEGLAPITFIDWLSDSANFGQLSWPFNESGLGVRPTFHLKMTEGIKYQWMLPLLQPFESDEDDDEPYFGYRWQVISWRERP